MLFAIAFNSKSFIITALGILANEGILKWDDKRPKFLPEFKMYDPALQKNLRSVMCLRIAAGLG